MAICVDAVQYQNEVQELKSLARFGNLGGRLVLHFDVNKTLCADDVAGGKPEVAMVIQELLAERYCAKWEPGLEQAITYSEYVNTCLYPGDKYDQKVRRLRFKKLHHFVEEYAGTPFGESLRRDFSQLSEALRGREVFESFFHCMTVLAELEIPTTVILRTFGEDLPRITQIIENKLHGVDFKKAAFKEGVLIWEGTPVEEVEKCLECLRQHRWIAIQDDFSFWRDGGKLLSFGKPFPLNPDDPNQHSLFFDDNIDLDPTKASNIVGPKSPEGPLPVSMLLDKGQLVRVDTAQAILDENYFIDQINSSLETRYTGAKPVRQGKDSVRVAENLLKEEEKVSYWSSFLSFFSYLFLLTKQLITDHQ